MMKKTFENCGRKYIVMINIWQLWLLAGAHPPCMQQPSVEIRSRERGQPKVVRVPPDVKRGPVETRATRERRTGHPNRDIDVGGCSPHDHKRGHGKGHLVAQESRER